MITTRFYTVIVRKDALAAKWPGGIEGFKKTCCTDSTQEDEDLITAGYSMGTDLHLILQGLKDEGLCIHEQRKVLQRVPGKAPWLFRFILGESPANHRFGRDEWCTVSAFVDVAVATLGMQTQSCDWLERVPGTNAVRFVNPPAPSAT